MSEAAKWYVVHTYSGYENKVASNLETTVENRQLHDLIQEIRVPTETVTEVKDGKQREVERKIFPGYVLVKMVMTDGSWYIVRNIRGCTGFVGPSSSWYPCLAVKPRWSWSSTRWKRWNNAVDSAKQVLVTIRNAVFVMRGTAPVGGMRSKSASRHLPRILEVQ